jgi:hypothetical protein
MAKNSKLKVLFIAGFGPIVRDIGASDAFYMKELGLPLKKDGDYRYTAELDGAKHFALWPLSQAAQSCFGSDQYTRYMGRRRCARIAIRKARRQTGAR